MKFLNVHYKMLQSVTPERRVEIAASVAVSPQDTPVACLNAAREFVTKAIAAEKVTPVLPGRREVAHG